MERIISRIYEKLFVIKKNLSNKIKLNLKISVKPPDSQDSSVKTP